MSGIQIFIGYQHVLIGQALRVLIEKHPIVESIYLVPFDKFEISLNEKRKSIAILEVSCASLILTDTIIKIQDLYPWIPILVATSITPHLSVSNLIKQNVSGLILTDCCSENDVFESMERIIKGETFYCSVATRKLFEENRKKNVESQWDISCREKEILQLLANGMKNKEIAWSLNISEATVKTHRRNLMKKLDSDDLLALVREACSSGILDPTMLPCCSDGQH